MKISDLPEKWRVEVLECVLPSQANDDFSPEAMFELLLNTQGIYGYGNLILNFHDEVFKNKKTYIVTGVDTRGRRFQLKYNSISVALSINLYRGSVWEVSNGKRKLLKRVYN